MTSAIVLVALVVAAVGFIAYLGRASASGKIAEAEHDVEKARAETDAANKALEYEAKKRQIAKGEADALRKLDGTPGAGGDDFGML